MWDFKLKEVNHTAIKNLLLRRSVLYHWPVFHLSCSADGMSTPQEKFQTLVMAVKSSSPGAEIWLPSLPATGIACPSTAVHPLSSGGALNICPWLSQSCSPLSFRFVYLGLFIVSHLTFSQHPPVNHADFHLMCSTSVFVTQDSRLAAQDATVMWSDYHR